MNRRGKPPGALRFLIFFASLAVGALAFFLFISSALGGMRDMSAAAGKHAAYQQAISTPYPTIATVSLLIAGFLFFAAIMSRFGLPTRVLAALLAGGYLLAAIPAFTASPSSKVAVGDPRLTMTTALSVIIAVSFLIVFLGNRKKPQVRYVTNAQEEPSTAVETYSNPSPARLNTSTSNGKNRKRQPAPPSMPRQYQ